MTEVSKRRRFRFSLRSLLLAVALAAMVAQSIVIVRLKRERDRLQMHVDEFDRAAALIREEVRIWRDYR
jgi:hypothetical protein